MSFRKEFFKVNIYEVADVIKQEFDQTLEITKLAQAEEYNRTLQILSESEAAASSS
ncbi:hypothetical protein [Exiguobacterium aurantiacum]|nr:hypothetical protein [Exiguobacterium aurantiacum]